MKIWRSRGGEVDDAAPLFGFTLTLTLAASVLATGAEAEATAALRVLAANPAAPQPAAPAALSFRNMTWLLGGLSPGDIRRLSEYLDKDRLTLPPNLEGAIKARTRKIQRPGDQGGR